MESSESEESKRAEKRRKLADDYNSDEDSDYNPDEDTDEDSNGDCGEELIEIFLDEYTEEPRPIALYDDCGEPVFVDYNDHEVVNQIIGMGNEDGNSVARIFKHTPMPHHYGEDGRLERLYLPPLGRPIPDCLILLDALTELHISDSEMHQIPNFFPGSFGRMASLRSLDISLCYSFDLPEAISELHNLECLTVNAYLRVTVPESFGNLTKLKELTFNVDVDLEEGERRGRHVSFPTSIGQRLTNLKKLVLCFLDECPEEIESFTSLEKLQVDGYFPTLPSSIGRLKNLCELKICQWPHESNTSEIALPDEIGELVDLEVLDLSYSHIASLPRSIGNLESLECLNLSYTNITRLPDEIGDLAYLKELYLCESRISTLPSTMTNLEYLETLHLIDTPMEKESDCQVLSEIVESLPRLVYLNYSPEHIPGVTLMEFDYTISHNRAKYRLGFLDATDGVTPFPLSLWPSILEKAKLFFYEFHRREYFLNEVSCMGPENESEPDAIFHLLVNYGTAILQEGGICPTASTKG